jgi:electron transport complex protein RnfG
MKEGSRAGGFALFKPAVSLTAICICVAAVLAVVNALTAERIAANLDAAEKAAIYEVFGDTGISAEELSGAPEGINSVYRVSGGDGTPLGFCVALSQQGFGGNIDMVVGLAPDGSVTGVEITSLSETPGLGSRVAEEPYLDGYRGKSGRLVLGADVDAISGATISSRSVLAGVNAAIDAAVRMGLVPGGGAS